MEQATRRLGVWRSNFGSTGIALIAHFLASGPNGMQPDPNETQPDDIVRDTCNELLNGLTFLYEDLRPRNPAKAFRSPFVLYLLADTHLRPCIGCPDIPRFDTNALKEHGVKGAIALCCSAVCNVINSLDGRATHGFSLSVPFVYSKGMTCMLTTRLVPVARPLRRFHSSLAGHL